MPPRLYDDATREHALAIYLEHGLKDAAAQTGILPNTISTWARRAGVSTRAPENLRAAGETQAARLEVKRRELAERMYEEAQKLLDQLWEPVTYFKVVTEGTGKGYSQARTVEHEVDRPVFADQKAIMVSAAIAVDKAQLLSGEATARAVLTEGAVDAAIRELVEQFPDAVLPADAGARAVADAMGGA